MRKTILILAMALTVCSSAFPAAPAKIPDFSAVQFIRYEHISEHGLLIRKDSRIRRFYKSSKMRDEILHENGHVSEVVIERKDKRLMWDLLPEKKEYIEIEGTPPDLRGEEKNPPPGAKKRKLGVQKFYGYVCDVVEISSSTESGHTTVTTLWNARKLGGIPIKTVNLHYTVDSKGKKKSSTQTREYIYIRVKPIPNSLFEMPRGYKKVKNFTPPLPPFIGG